MPQAFRGSDLTPEQIATIQTKLGDTLKYLATLQPHLEKLGMLPAEPLLYDVTQARHAMQNLHMRLHYLSCKSGVGTKPKGAD